MPQACQGDLFACAEDGIIYSPFKYVLASPVLASLFKTKAHRSRRLLINNRGGNAILAPFKEKVDFSQKKQDLRPINSPFLQVGKDTFLSSIFDTSRMDMRGSGEGSDGEREYEDQERRLGNDTKSLDKTSPPLSIPIYPSLLDGPLPTPQRHPTNKQP
jgi:hypothetical protein